MKTEKGKGREGKRIARSARVCGTQGECWDLGCNQLEEKGLCSPATAGRTVKELLFRIRFRKGETEMSGLSFEEPPLEGKKPPTLGSHLPFLPIQSKNTTKPKAHTEMVCVYIRHPKHGG